MYRILVIDDEPIIADGLYELFAQDETFALEVHKVYSAPDALKLLDRLRIDIVLSDIKMPGMNGLELLTQIHRRWPFCHVIFLSGYSDFEYVQKAMQLGADSYILKAKAMRWFWKPCINPGPAGAGDHQRRMEPAHGRGAEKRPTSALSRLFYGRCCGAKSLVPSWSSSC